MHLEVQVVPARAAYALANGDSLVTGLIKLLPAPRPMGRLPVQLMLLVERGPGMDQERRLELAGQAARAIADCLGPDDMVGLAVYGERAKLVMPLEPLGDGSKLRRMLGFLDAHAMGAGANLHAGLKAVAEDLRAQTVPAACRRVVVLTATAPVAAQAQADREAELLGLALAGEGVSFSAFGLGPEWHAPLLGRLADAGRGSVRHVPRAQDVLPAARHEGELLAGLVFADVRLRMRFAKGVRLRRFVQVFPTVAHWLPVQPSEREAVARVGELPGDRPCYMLAELVVPAQAEGTYRLATVDATFLLPGGEGGRGRAAELVVGFGEPLPPSSEVAAQQATFQAFSLVERALEARREADLTRARTLLENARAIVPRGRDNELDAPLDLAIGALERGLPMTENLAKALFAAARMPQGRIFGD